jgi:DNA-binding MarR family transcriptional regulator
MSSEDTHVRELALAVFATSGRLIGTGNELVAHLGLTSAWWQVLGALRYSPVPLPTAAIARNMGLTRQSVQRIVDLLAERGLVAFQDNPQHRRAKLVVLTEAGLAAVTGAEQAVAPLDAEIVDRIGRASIRAAIQTLDSMNAILSEWLDRAASAALPDTHA